MSLIFALTFMKFLQAVGYLSPILIGIISGAFYLGHKIGKNKLSQSDKQLKDIKKILERILDIDKDLHEWHKPTDQGFSWKIPPQALQNIANGLLKLNASLDQWNRKN